MERADRGGHARTWVALGAVLVVLASWNVGVRPSLGGPEQRVVGGVVVAVLMVVLGLVGGLDTDGLGLSVARLPRGLAYGAAAAGLVLAVVLIGLVLAQTRAAFHTSRADIGAGELTLQLLWSVPVGTVLVEELAFRGVLLGLLCRLLSVRWAVTACCVLFGLWHVYGVLRGSGSVWHLVASAAGVFLVTSAAGVAFCWLRLRSGSLVAPALAHLATNTVPLLVAWLVVH